MAGLIEMQESLLLSERPVCCLSRGGGGTRKISTGVSILFFGGLEFDRLLFFGLLKMRVIIFWGGRGVKNKHYILGKREIYIIFLGC